MNRVTSLKAVATEALDAELMTKAAVEFFNRAASSV